MRTIGLAFGAGLLVVGVLAANSARTQEENALQAAHARAKVLAALPGEPHALAAIGVTTKQSLPLPSIESSDLADGPKRRLVLLGGLDGNDRSVDAALGAVEWFKKSAPAAVREKWSLSVLVCGNPEGLLQLKPTNDSGGKPAVNYPPADGFFENKYNVEARYIWRWLSFRAPDLVVELRGANRISWLAPPSTGAIAEKLGAQPLTAPDTLPMALSKTPLSGLGTVPALVAQGRGSEGPAILQAILAAGSELPRSPLRQAVIGRLSRSPRAVAEILAAKYPQSPAVAYIPAVSWAETHRLARLTGDDRMRQKVFSALQPWLSGEKNPLEGESDVVKLGGHLAFGELALQEKNDAAKKLTLAAADAYKPEKEGDPIRYGKLWCEDMFMSATLLGRAGKLSGDRAYYDLMARSLLHYAEKLQQPSGLFHHAFDGPHHWGRGNGFASLGLTEALTYLPQDHPQRAAVLAVYKKQMAALPPLLSPDGTWRQVIDHPESYREVTATAMNLVSMARGVRFGWLDKSYRTTVDRAWRGLLPRVADDASLADVCTGTGSGPTLRHYYDRPAIFGPDDRGGAMCLWAANEVFELINSGNTK